MAADTDLTSEARSAEELEVLVRRLLGVTGAAYERRAQLERALRTRIVIEQAKGMLAERFELSVDEAFQLLRRAARDARMPIHTLAAEVVSSSETPAPIRSLSRRSLRGSSAQR